MLLFRGRIDYGPDTLGGSGSVLRPPVGTRNLGTIRIGEMTKEEMMARRICALLILFLIALPGSLIADGHPIRFGVTPVFLDDQLAFLAVWKAYLGKRLGRDVVFLQRGNYREITDLLRSGKLDLAWVCGYPLVQNREHMRLLAVPRFNGKPLYRSYLIVPRDDVGTRSILDLQRKVFAYSDPDSNSGYLYPQFALLQLEQDPGSFFARTFFTWGHRKVIEAVASGLAQGGAVDGYVWETLNLSHPELTGRTRVVERSPEFGFPPLVARPSLPQADFLALQEVLLTMGQDVEGAALLRRLNLDGFEAGNAHLFDGIARMARTVGGGSNAAALP